MAEARKLAGRVSAESEVTPRRSFSRNIFLQEGERVNVFVPSCTQDLHAHTKTGNSFMWLTELISADLIGSSLRSHGDEGVVLLLQELPGLRETDQS